MLEQCIASQSKVIRAIMSDYSPCYGVPHRPHPTVVAVIERVRAGDHRYATERARSRHGKADGNARKAAEMDALTSSKRTIP